MIYDRDLLLERTDLRVLAETLLGPSKGRGPSAMWPCPDRAHGEQTGRTPPVNVFVGRGGTQRWHCHSCGAGGTAIDLVAAVHGLSVRDAFEYLAARTGTPALDPVTRPVTPPNPPRTTPLPELEVAASELVEYVESCERILWSEAGAKHRAWLAQRAIPGSVLRANRVGADPGAHHLARARGLPRRGPAVVLPVLTPSGDPAYLQARYLDPERAGRKYDNPAEALAPMPKVALVTTPWRGPRPPVLVVCEGIPDALVIAGAGVHAAAVLGAGLPNAAVADRLARHAQGKRIVIAFDADARGRTGSERLLGELRRHPSTRPTVLALERGDLNDWAQRSGRAFGDDFRRALPRDIPECRPSRAGLARSL